MATREVSGTIASTIAVGTPFSLGITMGANEYPMQITEVGSGSITVGGSGSSVTSHLYFCDSAGNNAYQIFQVTGVTNTMLSSTYSASTYNKSVDGCTGLKGKALYLKITGGNLLNAGCAGKSIKIKTTGTFYTAVEAGNKILATDRSQTGTTTTAGTVMSDTHFTAGTKIEASTFNSQVLGL